MKNLFVKFLLICVFFQYLLLNINGELSSSSTCLICEGVFNELSTLIRTNISQEIIGTIAYGVCVAEKIEGGEPEVCKGAIDEFTNEIVYIFTQKYLVLGAKTICSHLGFCKNDGSMLHHYKSSKELTHLIRDTINYDSIKSEYKSFSINDPDIGTIVHLSDIHLDSLYNEGSLSLCDYPICCRNKYGKGTNATNTAGKYGAAKCDIPQTTLDSLIKEMQSLKKSPDFVLVTGDDPPHDVWKQSRAYNLEAAYNVTQAFKLAFGKIPVFSALGNHESYPVNQFRGPPYDAWLYNSLGEYWKNAGWLDEDTIETFKYAGYYSTLVPNNKNLRIISLNTMYCLGGNYWMLLENGTDPGQQLFWLNHTLYTSQQNNEKVYIIGHVPFGICTYGTYDEIIRKMVEKYQDTIAGMFFGHTHKDEFEIVRDSNDKIPISTMFIAPSVTTTYNLNPNYRIYYYNRTSKFVLDYDQYVMNLTHANLYDDPKWQLSYNMRQQYKMNDLRPNDYQDLLQRLSSDNNLFNIFMKHYYDDMPQSSICDNKCKLGMLCKLTSSTRILYEACLGEHLDILLQHENDRLHTCGG